MLQDHGCYSLFKILHIKGAIPHHQWPKIATNLYNYEISTFYHVFMLFSNIFARMTSL